MGIAVKRGQIITGRKELASELNMSEQNIRTAISHLKSTSEITIKVTNRFSIVTICNYERWIGGEESSNQQINQQSNSKLTNNQPANIEKKEKRENKKEDTNVSKKEFVEHIYAMYPSKCPVRKISLGKCSKDKEKIKKLLDKYSQEDIERVVKYVVEEKYGVHMMQNFSTFLNNFPDPQTLFGGNMGGTLAYPQNVDSVKSEDVNPTLQSFFFWAESNGVYEIYENKGNLPSNDEEYQKMLAHTIGGAKGFSYVCLVLKRDGTEQYEDNRGFKGMYLNFIMKNGLYKD